MAENKALGKAKMQKKDEFYTQLEDIENELCHYKPHFKDKVVFCNCDDPFESNFFKYFAMNFNVLGLKKLIATCYYSSPVADTEVSYSFDTSKQCNFLPKVHGKKIEITGVTDENGDGRIDLEDVKSLIQNKTTVLEGDGDFRSPECIELLKEADIVVTNPPFSLFREYVAQLMEYEKQFLIIGNVNALTYKEIFPLIKDNKLWLGYGFARGNAYFRIPSDADTSQYANGVYNPSTGLVKFRNCVWFTNLDIEKRHEELLLCKTYYGHEQNYPKYDNYDAINVDKTSDIPCDYFENISENGLTNTSNIDIIETADSRQARCVTASWVSPSPSSISTAQNNSILSDSTDMSKTTQDTVIDSQSADEKPMQESLLREGCNGIMGVPITFLDKYSPEQFEILGITQRNDDPYKVKRYTSMDYKNANDLNARAVIIQNGIPKPMYARILIKRRLNHEN